MNRLLSKVLVLGCFSMAFKAQAAHRQLRALRQYINFMDATMKTGGLVVKPGCPNQIGFNSNGKLISLSPAKARATVVGALNYGEWYQRGIDLDPAQVLGEVMVAYRDKFHKPEGRAALKATWRQIKLYTFFGYTKGHFIKEIRNNRCALLQAICDKKDAHAIAAASAKPLHMRDLVRSWLTRQR